MTYIEQLLLQELVNKFKDTLIKRVSKFSSDTTCCTSETFEVPNNLGYGSFDSEYISINKDVFQSFRALHMISNYTQVDFQLHASAEKYLA